MPDFKVKEILTPDFLPSLVATVKAMRPDLLVIEQVKEDRVIPAELPPSMRGNGKPFIEDIGEPMTAAFFTLSSVDPKDWYICRSLKFKNMGI